MVGTERRRGTAQGRGRAGAGQARLGHFFLLLFFSFSHMTSYHKFCTLTYHTLSKVMVSYDKRVAVLRNSLSLFSLFFFLLGLALLSFSGLALPSLGGLAFSLSFVLTLEEVICGITRTTFSESLFLHPILTEKYVFVIDIGEGQQWNRARRIYPKSRALGKVKMSAGREQRCVHNGYVTTAQNVLLGMQMVYSELVKSEDWNPQSR